MTFFAALSYSTSLNDAGVVWNFTFLTECVFGVNLTFVNRVLCRRSVDRPPRLFKVWVLSPIGACEFSRDSFVLSFSIAPPGEDAAVVVLVSVRRLLPS